MGASLFGNEPWQFVCPACGVVTSEREWRDAGAPEGAIAFSCIGRWTKANREAFGRGAGEPGPCNYAGGGLFGLNPVTVICPDGREYHVFAFKEAPTDA